MSLPSTQFDDLDICGNLVTQNIDVQGNAFLGSGPYSFHYVQGSIYATGNNQFTQGATYSDDSVFQKRVTIRDLTLQEAFVAQGDATYQGTMQTEQELKAIGHTVSIGRQEANETRMFGSNRPRI